MSYSSDEMRYPLLPVDAKQMEDIIRSFESAIKALRNEGYSDDFLKGKIRSVDKLKTLCGRDD